MAAAPMEATEEQSVAFEYVRNLWDNRSVFRQDDNDDNDDGNDGKEDEEIGEEPAST